MPIILSLFIIASSVLFGTLPAQAALITRSVSLSATPTAELFLSDILMGPFGIFDVRAQFWSSIALSPFNISSGDTLQTTVSFDAPVEIRDTLGGQPESIFLSIGNGVPVPGGFDMTRSHTASLTGISGDYTGDPLVLASSITATSEQASQITFGNITNSSMFITGLTITTDFIHIDPQTAPFTTATFFIVDEAVPALAPGALVLMGFGLAGLAAVRRRSS